jgi:beta-galactosidase
MYASRQWSFGAATIDRAEERRVELLKTYGLMQFAPVTIRHPSSFLDACDRVGIIVIDEALTIGNAQRTTGLSSYLTPRGKKDIDAMVLRDRNTSLHNFLSVGNEINERARCARTCSSKQLIAEVKRLDSYPSCH